MIWEISERLLKLTFGSALILGRKTEVDPAMAWIEPAAGDDLTSGEEVESLCAMGVGIAKE